MNRVEFGDPTDRIRVGVAMGEAIIFAICHANLEIPPNVREDDLDIFRQMVAQRRIQFDGRKIQISKNSLIIVVYVACERA